jgi:hypothetical protein
MGLYAIIVNTMVGQTIILSKMYLHLTGLIQEGGGEARNIFYPKSLYVILHIL